MGLFRVLLASALVLHGAARYDELLEPQAGSCRDASGEEPHRFAAWSLAQRACEAACSAQPTCSHYAWSLGQYCVLYGAGVSKPSSGSWSEGGAADAPVTQTGDFAHGYHCYVKADEAPCGGADALLFAYFRTPEESLHLAYSCDGLKFSAINGNEPVLKSTVGGTSIRDPYLQRGPDGKTFHLVSTGGGPTHIRYWNSTDLVHWSEQTTVPVMAGVDGTKCTWAPEWTFVKEKQSYFVFWSSETSETGGGKRAYGAWTPDFQSWSPAEKFLDPGYTVIDTDIIQVPQTDGSVQYNAFVKDERGHNAGLGASEYQGKFVRRATSSSPNSGFEATLGDQISPEFSEGPEVVHFPGAGREPWLLFFDCFEDGHFGVSSSADLGNWSQLQGCGKELVDGVAFPPLARHGSFVQIGNGELRTILAAEPAAVLI